MNDTGRAEPELVADDLAAIYDRAEALRDTMEQRLERLLASKEETVRNLATRLGGVHDKLASLLSDLDQRVDRATRTPRD